MDDLENELEAIEDKVFKERPLAVCELLYVLFRRSGWL